MPRNQDLSSLPCARRREFSTTFHDDPVSRPGNILIPIGARGWDKGVGERERGDGRHVSGLPFRLKLLVNKFVASDRRIFHGPCKKWAVLFNRYICSSAWNLRGSRMENFK